MHSTDWQLHLPPRDVSAQGSATPSMDALRRLCDSCRDGEAEYFCKSCKVDGTYLPDFLNTITIRDIIARWYCPDYAKVEKCFIFCCFF